MPQGLWLATGYIYGTPLQPGEYTLQVTATNSAGSFTKNIKLTVRDTIAVSTGDIPEAVAGQPYETLLEATKSDSLKWTLSSGKLPDGVKLSSSGKISGTPAKKGKYNFTVKVSGSGVEDTKSFTLTVKPASGLVIITDCLPGAVSYIPYKAQLKASSKTPVKWSIVDDFWGVWQPDGWLEGLSMDKNGVISGLPSYDDPNYNGCIADVTVQADNGSEVVKKEIQLNVSLYKMVLPETLSDIAGKWDYGIGQFDLASGLVIGESYDIPFSDIYLESIKVSEGTLLPGLALMKGKNDTYTLTGTPTKTGSYTFTLRGDSYFGGRFYEERTYTAKVIASRKVIKSAITASTLPDGAEGAEYFFNFAKDGVKSYINGGEWTVTKGEIPDGLYLDYYRGTFSGNASKSGTYKFTVQVTSPAGKASKDISLKIASKPIKPSVITAKLNNGDIGSEYSAQLESSGTWNEYTRWGIKSGSIPDGLEITPSGRIIGIPTRGGTWTFTAIVRNKWGSDTKKLTLKIGSTTKPTITTEKTLPNVSRRQPYFVSLNAEGSYPITWSVTRGKLPDGLKLDGDGDISGTPTKAGTFTFMAQASNSTGNDTREFTLKVTQTTVKGDIPASTTRRASYTGTPKASGGASPYTWSISAGKLPDGLKINASTGKITGTATKAGIFKFTVKAKDKNGAAGKKEYAVKVTQTAVKGDIPATITRRATFTGTPKVSGGASPYTWSISAGKLPDGLKINTSTGKITETPTKAGTFKFTVKAKDKNGAASTKAYTVKVTQTTLTGDIPTSTTRKASYTGSPKVSGGASPYTWSISAGKLLDGLKISSKTGKITGTPTKAGTFKFTVKAKDKNGAASTKAYTVKVTQTTLTGDIPTSTTRKASYTGSPKVSGGASPYTWSISAGKLPDGLKINTSTGKITGNPTKADTFNFTVKAKDKNGAASTKAYTVKVTQTTVKGDILATTTRKASYTATPKVSGGASPYTWSISAGKLPDGLKFNASTGKIIGTPTKAGTFKFTVKAKDKNGAASTKEYTVKVTQTKVTGTLANAVKGTSYTATPKASNGASPYVWSISAGSFPKGVKLNTSTGKITGTPTATGTFTFTLKAKDKNGAAGTKEYTLKVTANTTKSATPENKPDTKNDSEISTQEHNTLSALPVTPAPESAGNTAITLTPSLRVISDDIIASDIGRDNDIFTVRAGQPLTLILDGEIYGAFVCVDDEPIVGITISDEGTFTLPAEFVNGDFKVQVKSSDGKNESQEAFLISE